ncbi:class I SAM-dependent methyltransferase [Nitratiruptor sp. YY09-18]|uniref:class I SAM-dependent DNA methyltransferase n=1 Tax=Nitratiruptor sp. YY09-18 TaxID=2724901 RepID=UPI0019158631|nr:class I SAM-dependent methyltransferase [Nitratiruptor sp. YY09-18]BCD67707.1 methyltransferase [Nitratiruptor sp. YY09-18]
MSSFDKRANDWDKSARRKNLAKAVADAIKECISSKYETVIDFGCGTGLLGYHFLDDTSTLIGYDISQKMREEFNNKSPSLEKAYATDDFASLPQADLIISSMALHHIQDTDAIVAKLVSKLRPNGKVCIADLESEDGSFHDHGNEGVYHFGFDVYELAKIFQKHGLEIICKKRAYTIKKAQDYHIFLLCGQKS